MENNYLSVVIPIHNEYDNIIILNNKIIKCLSDSNINNYEIIYIDDGSTDDSILQLINIEEKYKQVKIITFIKNYGQTAAIQAGIKLSTGEIIITMDGDLQNDPKDIPKLINMIVQGYDVVSGWRKNRKDNILLRIIPSIMANWLISKISGVSLHDYGCTLKAYKSSMVKDLRLYGEMHRFIPIYAHWNGAKTTELIVEHHPRKYGKTKYGINRTFKVISDLMFIKYFQMYSSNPIHLFGTFGIFNFVLALLSFVAMLYLKYYQNTSFISTPIPLLVILFALVGIISIFMGFIAEILIRTYYESQNKLPYKFKQINK